MDRRVDLKKGKVHSSSSDSKSILSVLRSDLHANSLFLAGAPAANARTHTFRRRIRDLIVAPQLITLKG